MAKKPSPQSSPASAGKKGQPGVSREARRRGEKLRLWLEERGLRQTELAADAGLSEMTISKYVNGITDIANMRPPAITKLLDAMHISDSYAWELFEIPAAQRGSWRSLRSGTMGPPELQEGTVTYTLESGTQGTWQIPPGAVVTVSKEMTEAEQELVLARLDSLYWIAPRRFLPEGVEILGAFRAAALSAAETPH